MPLRGGTPGLLFGQILNFDCEGDEIQLSECTVSLLPNANYDHTDDAGVTCERCIDRCDLGSTRDVCTTTAPTQMTSTQELVTETTDLPTVIYTTDNVVGAIDSVLINQTILSAIIGILIVVLVAVIIGWIATCILVRAKMKGDYAINFDNR